MEQDFDLKHWEDRHCPKVDCKKNACKCGIKKVFLPAALGDDSAKSPIAPKNGAYCNAIVVYEANDHVYIYSTEGIPTLITVEGGSSEEAIEELTRRLNREILDRGAADNVLQGEIADKQNKLTAGANITIDSDNEISATDTTYSNFTGTDGVDPGTAGLVPAPATTDAGKFLKADGTWDTAGGGSSVTVVQTTGTSQADVMSQNATTSMVYADPSTMYKVNIGAGNTIDSSATAGVIIGKNAQIQSGADESIRIGSNGLCYGPYSIAIGYNAQSAAGTYGNTTGSIAIGRDAVTRNGGEVSIGASASTLQSGLYGAVNLGAYSRATRGGEVNVGSTNTMYGYNSTNYRVIGGVHDGQSAHDAATVGQLNGRVLQNAGAPTTATVGTVGQLLEDTTNGKLYQCTAIDTTDPNNPSYTWSEVGAGGGGPTVVQTTGTSQTDVMSQDAVTKRMYPRFGAYNDAIGIVGANESQDSSAGAMSIGIGSGNIARGDNSVAIGAQAKIFAAGMYSTAIGSTAKTEGHSRAVALGNAANAAFDNSVAIGSNAVTTAIGEVNIGAGTSGRGYNNTNYRTLSGLHDAQGDHDAVTLGQLNSRIIGSLTSAPTTSTVGSVGSLLATVESGTGHLYICTDDTGGVYTWQTLV